MTRSPAGRALAVAATAATAVWLGGCASSGAPARSAVEQIRQRGQLRVVTLNEPTSYYVGANGPRGFEYRLASAFARSLGVRLSMQPVTSVAAMRRLLASGRVDLAAAQITASADWARVGLPTDSYERSEQVLVRGPNAPHPRNITDLIGTRLVVGAGSPQWAMLRQMRYADHIALTWQLVPRSIDPLALVAGGAADYTVVDSRAFDFERQLYPNLTVAFALPDPRPVQWIARPGATDLVGAADRFFSKARQSGLLARIAQQSSAEARQFDYFDARRFQTEIARRLPALKGLFEQAAQATGLDWHLLAAVGYQESRWQSDARSVDGAEGIMMLTPEAAAAVGVKNRTDPRQSILGGAKYLERVINTVPRRIPEPDRTWLGLAAYNVGLGHLEDARILAQIRGLSPDVWRDVRAQLPLLTEQRWYARLKYGYARGGQPAYYVHQIRHYLAVLEWSEPDAVANSATWDEPTS